MKHYYYCVAFIAILATACGGGKDKKSQAVSDITLSEVRQDKVTAEANKATANIAADSTVSASPDVVNAASPHIDWDKKIIKTADIKLELKDYNVFNRAIHSYLNTYGAYISEENQTNNEYKLENSISIKVPVQNFESLVNSFSGDSIKLVEKRITSQDVTGEVVDTKARMEAKKQVRERYLNLLKQAHKMEDIISVQKEIDAIQEDIESATGRVDYLQHSAAYSTINLVYYQYTGQGNVQNDGQPGFFRRFVTAFKEGASGLYTLMLGLVTIWPLIIISIIVVVFIRKKIKIITAKK